MTPDETLYFGALFTLFLASLVLLRRRHVRDLRVHAIESEEERAALARELLEFVRDKSPNLYDVVDLRPFWRRRDLTMGDRAGLLRPLIDRGVLCVPCAKAAATPLETLSERVIDWALVGLPDRVRLSERDWYRTFIEGASSYTIVAEQIDMSQTWNANTNTGGGNIISSQSGGQSTAMVREADVRQAALPVDTLPRLGASLREDLLRVADPAARAAILALADECDRATPAADRDGSTARRILRTAVTYVGMTSGALEATSRFLQSVRGLF